MSVRLPAVLLLAGCAGRPEQSLTWRESWELLAALEDGTTLDLRAAVSNTGLLRGQGHMRLDRWSPREGPIIAALDAPPGVVSMALDRSGLRLGDAGVWASPDGSWRVEMVGAEAGATLTLTPETPALGPTTWLEGGGQWAVEAPVPGGELTGWVEAGKRGGLLRGRGVLLHRGGDGRPAGPREAAFVLGPELFVGLDRQGDGRLAWARIDGQDLDASDARLEEEADGRLVLDLRPASDLWVSLRPRPPEGYRDEYEHLLFFERPLAGWLGADSPRVLQRALAEVHNGASRRLAPALLLRVGADEDEG